MIKKIIFTFTILLVNFNLNCQNGDEYQVYAIKYFDGWTIPAQDIAVGASVKDSVQFCFMVWLLKGANGRNVLVDAGYIDTSKAEINYLRPDLALKRINVYPSDISDIILTHPHWDHIGGINLFPKAKVWMQKDDFEYFVGEAWQEDGSSYGFEKNDVRNIIEINLQGRLKLIKGDNIEIFPGIRVFIGSKHSFENQYLLVNSNSKTNKILIASDAVLYYYNLNNLLSNPTNIFGPKAHIEAMKRIKTLVTDPNLIIPGHDNLVFSKFPTVSEWVVKIGK